MDISVCTYGKQIDKLVAKLHFKARAETMVIHMPNTKLAFNKPICWNKHIVCFKVLDIRLSLQHDDEEGATVPPWM